MKEFETDWTKSELKAYIFIYCAHTSLGESEEELEFVKSKIRKGNFQKIHEEFDQENDYQSIQKIQAALKRHKYSKEEIESLMNDIKEMFLLDGKYDDLEKEILMGLKHLLI